MKMKKVIVKKSVIIRRNEEQWIMQRKLRSLNKLYQRFDELSEDNQPEKQIAYELDSSQFKLQSFAYDLTLDV